MPDDVENSSLQTATTEGTRTDGSAESAIDEGSEFDEEKNESEIVNVSITGGGGGGTEDFIVIKSSLAIKRRPFSRVSGRERICENGKKVFPRERM